MPAEQKSELAFLPLQAARSERPGVPALTVVNKDLDVDLGVEGWRMISWSWC